MNPLYSFKVKHDISISSRTPVWFHKMENYEWINCIGYKYHDENHPARLLNESIKLPWGVDADEYELELVPYQDHPEGYKFNILVKLKNQKPKSMSYPPSWRRRKESSIPSRGVSFGSSNYTEQEEVRETPKPTELPKPDIDFTEASFVFYPSDEPDVNFELRKAWLEGIIWYQNKLVKMNILADSSK